MKIAILLLVLSFVCFAASQGTLQQTTFTITNLVGSEVQTADGNQPFYPPANLVNDYVTVVVRSTYAVNVCFQEGSFAPDGVLSQSCNPEGYLPASGSDDSSSGSDDEDEFNGASTGGAKQRLLRRFFMETTVTNNGTLYLRNVPYTIAAAWADGGEEGNTTLTGDVQIDVTYYVCGKNSKGLGPNCNIPPQAVTPKNAAKGNIGQDSPALVQLAVSDKAFYTTVTFTVTVTSPTAQPHHAKRDLLSANQTTADFQVAVRRDAFPDAALKLVDPTETSTVTTNSSTVTTVVVSTPEGGNWNLLLTSNNTYSFTVSVAVTSCPQNTFPGKNGTSDCQAPWTIVANGTKLTNSSIASNGTSFAVNGGWITYFTWTTSNLVVGVVASDHGNDAPAIYASTVGIPSANGAEFVSANEDAEVNFVSAESPSGDVASWIIAVQAVDPEDETDFEIWAGENCANNCSSTATVNAGSCPTGSAANGKCSCNDHYKDFQCSTKTLKTIYIVLIAIGGAIVLAIAIGVPVGCYIKNRKRARYERV